MIEVEKIKMRVKYEISEIGEVIGGATPSTKDEDNYGGDISWITPKDLSSFTERYIYRGERNISEKGLHSCSAKLMPKDTVLFSSRAPIGYVAIAANKLCTNQGFKSIIADESKIHYLYLYYYLIYKKSEIEAVASGTTFKEVSGSVLKKFKIEIHESILEQKAIAATLSCLDDMIELNNRTNKVLEEMAQAIFKHWFVDFEFPNENGEPYKSSGGEMVDSELGEIPIGWRVCNLGAISEVVTKGTTPTTLKRSFASSGINFIKAESITDDHCFDHSKLSFIDNETNALLKRSMIKENDILFTIAGTIGRFAVATNRILPANTNQAVAIIRIDDSKCHTLFVFCYLLCGLHMGFYSKRVQQAVQANLSLTTIKELPLLIPCPEVLDSFIGTVSPLFDNIKYNTYECALLANIRDTLLPKLMSGEIRVPIEEVG